VPIFSLGKKPEKAAEKLITDLLKGRMWGRRTGKRKEPIPGVKKASRRRRGEVEILTLHSSLAGKKTA